MATVTETTGTLAWIRAQIAADASITGISGYGGSFDALAPDKASTPYVVVQRMSAIDMMTANGHRVKADQVWQIKGVAPVTQYAALVAIAIQLDHLFGDLRQAGDANVVVSSSVRTQEIDYMEVVSGVQWRHLGGLYAMEVWLA